MVAFSPTLKLAAYDSNNIQQVWKTINAESCPLQYNFHMHTICSDGQLTPLALIEQAIKIGLKGLAITDHHSVEGYYIAQKHLNQLNQEQNAYLLPYLWTGVEITSNLQGVEVHILGYGFTPHHPAIKLYLQGSSPQGRDADADAVIAGIHQAGGLAVLAHPARYRRPASELIPLVAHLGIDGVEAYYAYSNYQPWKPSKVQTQQVQQLAFKYNLHTTCGTDTHGLNLCQKLYMIKSY